MGLRRLEPLLSSVVKRPLFSPGGQGGSGAPSGSSLLTGLKAYYAFSAGAFLVDSSGNGNTLTNSGATQGTNGIIGDCLTLVAASSQTAAASNSSSLQFTNHLSMAFWMKPVSIAVNYRMFSKGILSTDMEFAGLLLNTGAFQFDLGSISGAISAATPTGLFTAGAQNHVVIVYDGNQSTNITRCKISVNGASQSLTFTGTFPAANTPGTNAFTLGNLTGSAVQYYDGQLDEVGLWNVPLKASQIASLYHGGLGVTWPFKGAA